MNPRRHLMGRSRGRLPGSSRRRRGRLPRLLVALWRRGSPAGGIAEWAWLLPPLVSSGGPSVPQDDPDKARHVRFFGVVGGEERMLLRRRGGPVRRVLRDPGRPDKSGLLFPKYWLRSPRRDLKAPFLKTRTRTRTQRPYLMFWRGTAP